jgi:hypothetical protein
VDRSGLIAALETILPRSLAEDFADNFIEIRRDVATQTLGRASPGKFVETTVQALQAIEQCGRFDKRPDVDRYLKGLESRQSTLPDGLRICAARLGRAMYSLRSKRDIVHKGDVNASAYDLRLLYASAQWVLAELLALAGGVPGDEAARLVMEVQLPVGELVETYGDRKIAHGNLTVREEALVLLSSYHPQSVAAATLIESMDRRSPNSVRNVLTALWRDKLIHRADDGEVILTGPGLREAVAVAGRHLA